MGKPYMSSPSGGPCWTRERGYHTPDPWPQHIWDAINSGTQNRPKKAKAKDMSKGKVYLGDGLYARMDECGGIWVTSENGVEVLNEVYFEPQVLAALNGYATALPVELPQEAK